MLVYRRHLLVYSEDGFRGCNSTDYNGMPDARCHVIWDGGNIPKKLATENNKATVVPPYPAEGTGGERKRTLLQFVGCEIGVNAMKTTQIINLGSDWFRTDNYIARAAKRYFFGGGRGITASPKPDSTRHGG